MQMSDQFQTEYRSPFIIQSQSDYGMIVQHIDLKFAELEAIMLNEFRMMRESRLSYKIWSWIKGLFGAV